VTAPGGVGRAAPDPDAGRAVRERMRREAAAVLPVLGTVLLMPPVVDLVAVEGRILGVPVPVAYLTAVWAGLILGAALLSRPLGRAGEEAEPPGDGPGGRGDA